MASERIQRRIDRLLDQIEQEADQDNWQRVLDLAKQVLGFAPDDNDAKAFLGVAEERLSSTAIPPTLGPRASAATPVVDQPTSFADGRYQVKRFLGEGGKKKVYLAHDTTLDREVAFALTETEGLDDTSRTRIQRDKEPEELRSEMGVGAEDIAEIVSDVRERLPGLRTPPQLQVVQDQQGITVRGSNGSDELGTGWEPQA